MRVAIVSPYALSVFGGAQEQALSMSRELARRGHDVVIVAPDRDDHATYDTPAAILRFGPVLKVPANGSRAPLTLSPRAARRPRGPSPCGSRIGLGLYSLLLSLSRATK